MNPDSTFFMAFPHACSSNTHEKKLIIGINVAFLGIKRKNKHNSLLND